MLRYARLLGPATAGNSVQVAERSPTLLRKSREGTRQAVGSLRSHYHQEVQCA